MEVRDGTPMIEVGRVWSLAGTAYAVRIQWDTREMASFRDFPHRAEANKDQSEDRCSLQSSTGRSATR